jgi:dihydroflavonol-4-reductase
MLATVTGASGHLGANLIRALVSRGWQVRALVHCHTRSLNGVDVERVSGDILNRGSLEPAFRGVDVVFHLAAHISIVNSDRKQVETVNVTGTRNVVDACMAAGVRRLVYTSSFHAHRQEPLDEILDESRPLLGPGDFIPYDCSKAKGERTIGTAVAKGLDAIVINPTGMIGPYDFQPSHFGAVLLAMARGRMPVIVDAGLNWVDSRDVAAGMIRACELSKTGEKYILGGHWVKLADIAIQVSRITGCHPPRLVLPLRVAKAGAPLAAAWDSIRGKRQLITPISIKELESNSRVSHAKASRELGYEPRPLSDTLSDTLEWFRASGYLDY